MSIMSATRATRVQQKCNTNATKVQHECDKSATRVTQAQHDCDKIATRLKIFDFDNDTSENIFPQHYINYIANERLQRVEELHSKN